MAEKKSSGTGDTTSKPASKTPARASARASSATATKAAVKGKPSAKAAVPTSTKGKPSAKAAVPTSTKGKTAAKSAGSAKTAAKTGTAAKTAATKPAAKAPTASSRAGAAKPAAEKSAKAKPAAKSVEKATKPAAKAKPAEPAAKPAATEAPAAPPKPATKKAPPFVVGDKVVYPHHGAATITAIQQMGFQGEKRPYYVLEVATDQLVVSVPVDGALDLGVRPVISTNVARKVFATFRDEPQEAGANWSRWYKLLTEKINSGDIFQVAEVVRDLTYAQQIKGISPALKRMLAKARLIIVSELRFALKLDEEDAIRRLDRALPRVDEPIEL